MRAGIQPGDLEPAQDPAPVEVRDEPAGGAQKRRLTGARAAGEHDELARLDAQVDVPERVALGVRIPIGEAARAERRVSHATATSAA